MLEMVAMLRTTKVKLMELKMTMKMVWTMVKMMRRTRRTAPRALCTQTTPDSEPINAANQGASTHDMTKHTNARKATAAPKRDQPCDGQRKSACSAVDLLRFCRSKQGKIGRSNASSESRD